MDGVIADFAAGVRALGIDYGPEMNRSGHEMPDDARARKHALYERIAGTGFFRELPLIPGAHELWRAVRPHRHRILTAVPQFADPADVTAAADDKHAFLCVVFEPFPRSRFIACRSRDKPRHMRAGRPQVLIDDRASNCRAWEDAGGLAIPFEDSHQARRALDDLLRRFTE